MDRLFEEGALLKLWKGSASAKSRWLLYDTERRPPPKLRVKHKKRSKSQSFNVEILTRSAAIAVSCELELFLAKISGQIEPANAVPGLFLSPFGIIRGPLTQQLRAELVAAAALSTASLTLLVKFVLLVTSSRLAAVEGVAAGASPCMALESLAPRPGQLSAELAAVPPQALEVSGRASVLYSATSLHLSVASSVRSGVSFVEQSETMSRVMR